MTVTVKLEEEKKEKLDRFIDVDSAKIFRKRK
jgi:hypothetical protein